MSMNLRGRRLGDILQAYGLVDTDTLTRASAHAQAHGSTLGRALVETGAVTEDTIVRALAVQSGLPCVDLSSVSIPREALGKVPSRVALAARAVPVAIASERGRDVLVVAIASPKNLSAIDEIAFVSGMKVRAVVASDAQITAALTRNYGTDPRYKVEGHRLVDLEDGPGIDHVVDRYFDFS